MKDRTELPTFKICKETHGLIIVHAQFDNFGKSKFYFKDDSEIILPRIFLANFLTRCCESAVFVEISAIL